MKIGEIIILIFSIIMICLFIIYLLTNTVTSRRKSHAKMLREMRNCNNDGRLAFLLESIGSWKDISYGPYALSVYMSDGWRYLVCGKRYFFDKYNGRLYARMARKMIHHKWRKDE